MSFTREHVVPVEEKSIDLKIGIYALKKHALRLGLTAAIFGSLAGFSTFFIPNIYTASALILPIEKNSSNNLSALLGAMGGGLGMLAGQAGIGGNSAGEKFVTIMESRTISAAVIKRLDLLPFLFPERWDAMRKVWKKPLLSLDSKANPPSLQEGLERMRKLVSISTDKGKKIDVVRISVSGHRPEVAAQIANTYLIELDNYLKNNSLSAAKRNRVFIESQYKKAQEEMAGYEVALKDFQQKNRIVSLDAQAEVSVKTYADLKASLIAAEVELNVLKKGTLEGDPRVALKQQQIDELNHQLAKVESGGEMGPIVSFNKAPSLGLTYARLKRDLLVREKVIELLTQQYEMAKIQEAQEDISFQILDAAIPPEKKTGPKRLLITLCTIFVATATGVALVLGKAYTSTKVGSEC